MKSSDYFNIGPRLTLAFALFIALILAGNALVIWQFHTARIQTDRLAGANQQLIAVLQLQVGLLSFHQRLDDLARSGDAHHLTTEAEPLRRALQEQVQQTKTAAASRPPGAQVDPAFLPTLETIEVALPAQLDAINDLAKSGDWGTVQHRLDYELKPIETQASILVGSIQQQANGELAQAVLKMGSAQRRILFIVPVTAIFTSFIAAFFGWVITRRIVELRLEERVSERTRIARELHDTLIQSVDGLMLYLQAAMDEPDRERSHQMLEKALDRADEVLSEGRERVHTLRTESITANDLSQALTGYGEERAQDHATEFSVTLIGNPRPLDPIIRDEVFRIGREALANAFQHSGASKIEVELTYDRNEIRLRIRDDGSGIDPLIVETGKAGHWGLSGMRERANRVGAELNVWSGPNVGTE